MIPRGANGRAMDEHQRIAFGDRQKAVELRAMVVDFENATTQATIETIATADDKLADVQEQLASDDEAAGRS
jgi:hypothetical protein